jgi:hypothetical protein
VRRSACDLPAQSFDLIEKHYGERPRLNGGPRIRRSTTCCARTVGRRVQVESRAQMSMLPRLRPGLLRPCRRGRSCDRAPFKAAWSIPI